MDNIDTKLVFSLLLYAFSGVSLTLINKLVIAAFPFTNLLLVLQNGATIFLLLTAFRCFPHTFGPRPPLSLAILRLWMPAVIFFVVMLTSSLVALFYVSIPTVIAMRNLSTLLIAAFECALLKNRINRLSGATLLGMLLGALFYARHDLTFNIRGCTWLCLNIVGTSAYQIYIKKIIDSPLINDAGPAAMSYYNNLLSLPFLLTFAVLMGELTTLSRPLTSIFLREIRPSGMVLLSCALAFSLSTSAFMLNQQIFATSLMVVSNMSKFAVLTVTTTFLQPTLDLTASLVAIFVLFLAWLYSQAAKQFAEPLFVFVLIVFSIITATCEYRPWRSPMTDAGLNRQLFGSNRFSTLMDIPRMKTDMDTARAKAEGQAIYQSFLPTSTVSTTSGHLSPGVLVKAVQEVTTPEFCSNQGLSITTKCPVTRSTPANVELKSDYPRTTNAGERTGEFINRVLEVAWGSHPPSVDLYLRSGADGIAEMKYLFESIELFWPRFLGSIVVVLDAGDEVILKQLLPANPTHHYVIAFEHVPCLPARIFNQYSYLNLDRHSTAEYVVTVDSDCVFHSPVTPDLLFRQGKVILASSRTFQPTMWGDNVNFMLGAGLYDGHYMVTQPVTFSLATFSSFRKWFYESKHTCYEERLAQLPSNFYSTFCWMCQLGTYLEKGNSARSVYNQHWYQHLDDASLEPMIRYAIHVTYEPLMVAECRDPKCYDESVNAIIKQGLCRAFGSSMFHICTNYSTLAYVNKHTFLYGQDGFQAAPESARSVTLGGYLERLHNATAIVLLSKRS